MTPVQMTAEDAAIVHNLRHVPFMAWLVECRDGIDYRAMLAREVHAEREWRVHGEALTPVTALDRERALGNSLREHVERQNGEDLA